MRKIISLIALILPVFCSGCRAGEGRMWSDIVQVLLTQSGEWWQWAICVGLILVLWQLWRVVKAGLSGVRWLFRQAWKLTLKPNWKNLSVVAILGTMLWLGRGAVVDMLQEIEQIWFPVYLNQYSNLNEEHATALYETELSKVVDSYEYNIITRRTREIAVKIQSSPLAIYQCAHMECGLNPYTVRRDQVAAGWIQFTRIGLQGWTLNGKKVEFEQVLEACRQRNIAFIMDITEAYLIDKYERSGKKPLYNTIDLYLALFAPALIGAPGDKVVYQNWDNPSYYLNKGLDGWYKSDENQIIRKNNACDGKISVWEMFLALEFKKNRLMSRYIHR